MIYSITNPAMTVNGMKHKMYDFYQLACWCIKTALKTDKMMNNKGSALYGRSTDNLNLGKPYTNKSYNNNNASLSEFTTTTLEQTQVTAA